MFNIGVGTKTIFISEKDRICTYYLFIVDYFLKSAGKIVTQPTDSQCDSIHQVFAFYASPNIMPKPMRHVLEAKRRTTMSRTLESEFGNPVNGD